jgi:hypothetical protein
MSAEPWAARAQELADWGCSQVNRTDRWGGYRPLAERGRVVRRRDGTERVLGKILTHPQFPSDRGKLFLTRGLLLRHFGAAGPEDVIGLHTTSDANTSRWGAVEIDRHGLEPHPDVILAAACTLRARQLAMGFRPLLTDSNGAGGIHLRTLFREPVPTPRLFAWLRQLTDDYLVLGLTARPETFPKQARLKPGQVGNWLRLPGLHHTRDHWARVWSGSGWLAGADAVREILSYTGDDLALVPEIPLAPEPPPPSPRPRQPPGVTDPDRLSRRIAAYLARLPNLGEGQGRDDVAYGFACWLTRDLDLSDDAALDWLCVWDAGNRPPKGSVRLQEILAHAHAYGQRSPGCGRDVVPSGSWVIPGRRPGHCTLHCRLEID